MKTRMRNALLIVAATATTLLFNCALPPVSIEQRISDFVTSLNGDRSDTYTNLDPSIATYSLGKPAAYWDIIGPTTNVPFSYTPNPPVTSNPSDVEITISDNNGVVGLYKFVMVNIGTGSDNWVIHGLQTPPGTVVF